MALSLGRNRCNIIVTLANRLVRQVKSGARGCGGGASALLRWGLDMKQDEIAAVLHMSEKTVSVHLSRVRRKLLVELGGTDLFDDGTPEGAS